MCIPHGATRTINTGFVKKPSKSMLEKGDSDFVDERKPIDENKKEESLFDKLFKD